MQLRGLFLQSSSSPCGHVDRNTAGTIYLGFCFFGRGRQTLGVLKESPGPSLFAPESNGLRLGWGMDMVYEAMGREFRAVRTCWCLRAKTCIYLDHSLPERTA